MTPEPEGARKKAAYHHGDLRQQLILATRTLVEERGPEGFSVAEAARRAGVSSAAPYRHFRDRTAILSAVAEDGMLRMSDAFGIAAAPHPDGSLAAISAIGQAYVAFAEAEPNVFRLMFAARDCVSDDLSAAGAACYGHLLRQVAVRLGCAPDDPAVKRTGFPLWTVVHGAAFLTIDAKVDKADLPVTMAEMIATATAQLLAPPPR